MSAYAIFQLRIAHLGIPDSTCTQMQRPVVWDDVSIGRLKELGFNAIQLNVAWGSRPDDEILNLEDVVELPTELAAAMPQVVPLRCRPGAAARERRRGELAKRVALCRRHGLRTIFHCGTPYNAHCAYGDTPPNCICDPLVAQRYAALIEVFHRDFPGVDDLWLYTYDQDAWLCSEFGSCPRCQGRPLHTRLVPFINGIAAAWRRGSPAGRTWWEPWELSAGQVMACIHDLRGETIGLALHSNIAEVMAAHPVDRWLRNAVAEGVVRGIPVVVEHFLGSASEELEPVGCLAHPLVTWRALRAIAALPGVAGIKEYYGLDPLREDPDLRATALFLRSPHLSEEEMLAELARLYGAAAADIIQAWRLSGSGMELFPWDTSWFIRELGRSRTDHALSAAMLRGQQAHTPSWESTRRAIFMKTDDAICDPWMLEDVELRCRQAAVRWAEAELAAARAEQLVPANLRAAIAAFRRDLGRVQRRAVAYACHLRATNVCRVLRTAAESDGGLPAARIAELGNILAESDANHQSEVRSESGAEWTEMAQARSDLAVNPRAFLATWFTESDVRSGRGHFSVTSR